MTASPSGTTAAVLDVKSEAMRSLPSPAPLSSLAASAARLTSKKITRPATEQAEWQADAWNMFNLVGEEHFLATTLASRLSQARLYVGKLTEDPTQPPEQVDAGAPAQVFDALTQGTSLSQMLYRLALGLTMAGESWLAGIPRDLLPEAAADDAEQLTLPPPLPGLVPGEVDLGELEWRALSVSEVSSRAEKVVLHLGPSAREDHLEVSPEDIYLIRVWRPHPQFWWEADAPTRSSLPVLHELVGLTMHISAQVDSRLAGAGLLLVPQSAARAIRIATNDDPDSAADPFTESLMEAMLTPIKDRASAAAVVPLVATVPDESADRFRFLSFATPLDTEARNLRDEAIRRLALGQDAPPELLLGTAGMNHWGSWLIREDVVSTHLEPPLALICDALSTQFLQPVLVEQGMPQAEASQYVIWYDVSHLVTRPNRFADATSLYEAGVLSASALRTAGGFTKEDAPAESSLGQAERMALTLVQTDPSLITAPGLPALVTQLRALMDGTITAQPSLAPVTEDETLPIETPGSSATPEAGEPGLPSSDSTDQSQPVTSQQEPPL